MFNSFDHIPYGILILHKPYLPQWNKIFTFAWCSSGFSKDCSSPDGAVLVEMGAADVDGNQLRSGTVLDDTEGGVTVELAVLGCC